MRLAGSVGKNKRKAATKPTRKQLAAKLSGESIRMKPAKDKQQAAPATPGSRRLKVAK